ncbi:M91 family zinc metallopeptidase [Pseudomonas sp. 1152_12]|uniref:M91 family zinc metallopeptidase n=1 Tax=Pseudomonas sp. 1152_12 TaxID=2604455 RepID=UPI0040638557
MNTLRPDQPSPDSAYRSYIHQANASEHKKTLPPALIDGNVKPDTPYNSTPATHKIPQNPSTIDFYALFKDASIHVSRECTVRESEVRAYPPKLVRDTLTIKTGDGDDIVNVSNGANGHLRITINTRIYDVKLAPKQTLKIQTEGGNDRIKVDSDVHAEIQIEGGDGDDHIWAGGGRTRVFGGAGSDHIYLGAGTSYAEGGDGADWIQTGTGRAVVYGNNGNDVIQGYVGPGGKPAYMDGGSGKDQIHGGSSHTVMNGGLDDDTLSSVGRATFYSGKGDDTIVSIHDSDLIYAKKDDLIKKTTAAKLTLISPSDAGKKAFTLEGSTEFQQRINDDLEMLRGSPAGQEMLSELDRMTKRNGFPLKILEVQSEDVNFYTGHNEYYENLINTGQKLPIGEDPKLSTLQEGKRGDVMTSGDVFSNRSYVPEGPVNRSPLSAFYHELSHAYNFGNGTVFPGKTDGELNLERQAVGLDTNAPEFDFDDDPLTPASNTNPYPFNENALHEEMGEPLRDKYRG